MLHAKADLGRVESFCLYCMRIWLMILYAYAIMQKKIIKKIAVKVNVKNKRTDMTIDFSKLASLLECEHQIFVKDASNSFRWKSLLGSFADDLKMYVRSFGLGMTNSWGTIRWTYFPWIRLYFPEMSKSPQDGIFIDYLFGWEDHEAFLTLLQGVDKTHSSELDRIKKLIQSKVDSGSFIKSPFGSTPVIDGTAAKCARAESYVRGMIFQKKYTRSSLPDSSQLEADLKEIINIYAEVKSLKIK